MSILVADGHADDELVQGNAEIFTGGITAAMEGTGFPSELPLLDDWWW